MMLSLLDRQSLSRNAELLSLSLLYSSLQFRAQVHNQVLGDADETISAGQCLGMGWHSVGAHHAVRHNAYSWTLDKWHGGADKFGAVHRWKWRQGMNAKVIKDVATRLVALFISSALGIITGTGVIDAFSDSVSVPLWFQALQAGGAAVALVVYDLSKSLTDGKLTKDEIDSAFGIDRSKHDDSI
jgi:hypothetical protein